VLLGGGSISLNMGQYFNFGGWPGKNKKEEHGGKPHNHMLVTLLHALGVPANHFGSPDIKAGDLDEWLLGS